MTPEAESGFREFLWLPDIAADDEPTEVFRSMAIIAAWAFAQAKDAGAQHDEMLAPLRERTSLWMGLLLHLATVDRHFYFLSRRMAARTLVRHNPPSQIYRQMAAALLTSDPPNTRRPKLAAHTAMVIGVAVGQQCGWRPTEADHKNRPMSQSGCGKMAEQLAARGAGLQYGAVEKVWKARNETLLTAGFLDTDISAFFTHISPMK